MDTEPTLADRERQWNETEREYYVKQGSKEWHNMWAWVGRHPLNKGIVNPTIAENHGETWQYMGTMKMSDGTYSHRFRHRFHPVREALGAEVRAYLHSANARMRS